MKKLVKESLNESEKIDYISKEALEHAKEAMTDLIENSYVPNISAEEREILYSAYMLLKKINREL